MNSDKQVNQPDAKPSRLISALAAHPHGYESANF